MSKLITGILSVFLIVGIIGVYIPNALASNGSPNPPLEICNGNVAAGQQGGSAAEEEIEQGQASEQNAQCVSGDFSLICGNNVNLQLQDQLGNLALAQQ